MKFSFTLGLSTLGFLMTSFPAYSFTFNQVSFSEDFRLVGDNTFSNGFQWIFTLSGQANPNPGEVYSPQPPSNQCAGTACWNLSLIAFPDQPSTITFLGQHNSRADVDDFFVAADGIQESVNIANLAVGQGEIFRKYVTHQTVKPPDHKDLYTLSYSRTINNDAITFTYKGSHQVPEPSSILSLLALGTLGTASTLKRKLKSSKSSEMETTKVS